MTEAGALPSSDLTNQETAWAWSLQAVVLANLCAEALELCRGVIGLAKLIRYVIEQHVSAERASPLLVSGLISVTFAAVFFVALYAAWRTCAGSRPVLFWCAGLKLLFFAGVLAWEMFTEYSSVESWFGIATNMAPDVAVVVLLALLLKRPEVHQIFLMAEKRGEEAEFAPVLQPLPEPIPAPLEPRPADKKEWYL